MLLFFKTFFYITHIINMSNKIYRNNKTGESIKVVDIFENVVILDNRQKLDINTLIESYIEIIDPSSFLDSSNAFDGIIQKLKDIPLDNIIDESPIRNQEFQYPENDSAVIGMISPEQEMEELMKKYSVNNNADTNSIDKIVEQFEEAPKSVNNALIQPTQPTAIDPIISIFNNAKRNLDFSMSIDINGKIPRLDFIEMMEDSYNTSIIDYLADDFTKQLLRNPNLIKDSITKKIKEMVYKNKPIDEKPRRTRTKKVINK